MTLPDMWQVLTVAWVMAGLPSMLPPVADG